MFGGFLTMTHDVSMVRYGCMGIWYNVGIIVILVCLP